MLVAEFARAEVGRWQVRVELSSRPLRRAWRAVEVVRGVHQMYPCSLRIGSMVVAVASSFVLGPRLNCGILGQR